MISRCRSFAALAALMLSPASTFASVVTYMDVETLTRLSPIIVHGRVSGVVSLESPDAGGIVTEVSLEVWEVFRGPAALRSLRVRLLGGRVGAREARIFGSPRFGVGEEVILFASPTNAGWLTVTGLFQGKIGVERVQGQAFAVRGEPGDASNVLVVPRGRPQTTRVPLTGFLDQLRQFVTRISAPEELDPDSLEAVNEDLGTPNFTLLLIPFRRFEPDSRIPLVYRFNPANAPNVPGAGGARQGFVNALAAWNGVTGHSLQLQDGGDTTAQCFLTFDGVSGVSHDDPCGEMQPFDSVSCSGVLAIGGLSEINPFQRKTINGQVFLRGLQGDVVLNRGAGCFFEEAGNYEEVLSHELGHTVGLGHSCGDANSPNCDPGSELDEAQMRAFAHGDGRGADPRRDDEKGVRFIYPPRGFVELRAADASVSTGENARLTMDLNGTGTGDLWFFSIVPGGAPMGGKAASAFPLSFAADLPVLDYTFTGPEPPGAYVFVAILTIAGGNPQVIADRLSVGIAFFTFTP